MDKVPCTSCQTLWKPLWRVRPGCCGEWVGSGCYGQIFDTVFSEKSLENSLFMRNIVIANSSSIWGDELLWSKNAEIQKKYRKKVHIKHQKFELSFCVLYEENNFWDQICTLSRKISSEIPYKIPKIKDANSCGIWGTVNFWTRKSKNIWKNIFRKALKDKEESEMQIRPVYEGNNFFRKKCVKSKK